MKRLFAIMVASAALTIGSSAVFAQMMKDDPMVGGAAMYPGKTIVANAMNSADHTTLVAAVQAAGLVDTLNGKGPFTVFASRRPTTLSHNCRLERLTCCSSRKI